MTRVGQLFREQLVGNIKSNAEKNSNVFLLSYSRLSGNTINTLRKDLKKNGATMSVAKNALARLALKEIEGEELVGEVGNQTAFVWTDADSVEVSKILVNFAKECETFAVKGGLLEGRVIKESDVKRLSDLPSRQVLLAMLLGTIQAPVTRILGAMNAKSRDLLSILKQLSEKKGNES